MSWVTLKTARYAWEAEMMAQILVAHRIPVQVVPLGGLACLGGGDAAELRVRAADRWTALLLLSPPEEDVPEEDAPEEDAPEAPPGGSLD